MTTTQRCIKRSFDLLAASFGLLTLGAPMALLAIFVKITSKGPAFFRQTRIGRYGKPFTVIKFRTMYVGAEREGSVTTATDQRITPIGRFLRTLKLDELPQIFNVFIGKMSFVGPRPDVPGYADRLEGEKRRILLLRPGITGPATLYFRNEEELLASVDNPQEYNDTVIWPKKVALNCEYYDHWSLWKDIGCILRTVAPLGK